MLASFPCWTVRAASPGESILVRGGHGFGVDGFLAGYAFQAGEDAVVVVFVELRPTSRTEREKWGTRFLFRHPRSTEILRWESLAFASGPAASG